MNNEITCQYCGKICSKYGIKNHIAIVHTKTMNASHKGGRKNPWNKGLNKESDLRIYKQSKCLSKTTKGKRHSIDTKIKISESRIKYLKEYPEKHPNRLCAGKKSIWQNKLYEELKKIETDIEYEQLYDGYWMDIVEPNKKINIEYDGVYWHNENDDKIRDEKLKENGWKILRISSDELNRNKQDMEPITKKYLIFAGLV